LESSRVDGVSPPHIRSFVAHQQCQSDLAVGDGFSPSVSDAQITAALRLFLSPMLWEDWDTFQCLALLQASPGNLLSGRSLQKPQPRVKLAGSLRISEAAHPAPQPMWLLTLLLQNDVDGGAIESVFRTWKARISTKRVT
jgi:hypothetical protein